jgi:hypothetical protein
LTVVAGSSIPLVAAVSDPASVLVSVQFLLDGTPLATTPAPGPYTFTLTAPAPGSYQLTVQATDNLARVSTGACTLNVVAADPNSPAPAVTILTDCDNRSLPAGSKLPLTVSASAFDSNQGLTGVDFYADGKLFAALDANGNPVTGGIAGGQTKSLHRESASGLAPNTIFQATYTLPSINRTISLLAIALDKLGRSQPSAPVTVQAVVTTSATPSVALATANGSRTRVGTTLTVPINVSASGATSTIAQSAPIRRDNPASSLIARMEYYINELKVKDSTEQPFSYTFSPPSAGTYVLSAIGTDTSGLSIVSAPVEVNAFVAPVITVAVKGAALAVAGGQEAKLVFTRSGDASADVNVLFQTKGAPKSDFKKLTGAVTIPAGQVKAKLLIKAKNGAPASGASLTIKLLPSPAGDYDLGAPSKAKLVLEGQN